jgi:hypothetical protein
MKYMKRLWLLGLLCIPAVATGPLAQTASDSSYTFYDSLYADELPEESTDAVLPELVPFGVGERLVYSVQYGLITAGEATLEIRNIATLNGNPCYRIVSDARTIDFF